MVGSFSSFYAGLRVALVLVCQISGNPRCAPTLGSRSRQPLSAKPLTELLEGTRRLCLRLSLTPRSAKPLVPAPCDLAHWTEALFLSCI
jgi:hypothetical protein